MATQITTQEDSKANPPATAFDPNKFPDLNQANLDLLKSDPYNVGTYGNQLSQGLNVFKTSFKNVAGRDPTADELNNYFTNSLWGQWHAPGELQYTDLTAGANNYIANNWDVTQLQAGKGDADAPAQYGAVDQAFQTGLGRVATQEEKDHFGKLLANKSLDPYTLNQWITQLPENVKKQDAAFQSTLRDTMSTQDARYFNEQIMPGISSSFAKNGRSFDSSAYANALAQAAQQQNTSREGFLNNLSVAQYSGDATKAYAAYVDSLNRSQGAQDYAQNRFDNTTDTSLQRLYDTQGYNTQQAAYNSYLAKYGKRNMGAQGAVAGAGAGATIGTGILPGYGTAVGAVVGGVGGYLGANG